MSATCGYDTGTAGSLGPVLCGRLAKGIWTDWERRETLVCGIHARAVTMKRYGEVRPLAQERDSRAARLDGISQEDETRAPGT
jgi:hypothetical protein